MEKKTDMVAMPSELTSENGAREELSGEFNEPYTAVCGDCEGDGEFGIEACELCEGSGYVVEEVVVSWPTIKRIYAMVVEKVGEGKITMG